MRRNLKEQILVCIERLLAGGYSQREVKRILDVLQGCINNYSTQLRHWSATPAETWRLKESGHSPRNQTVDPNSRQGQSIHLGSSPVHGYGPLISEEAISLEHCKQSSGCWLSV